MKKNLEVIIVSLFYNIEKWTNTIKHVKVSAATVLAHLYSSLTIEIVIS